MPTLILKRTLCRMLLAAVAADVAGTIIIFLLAASVAPDPAHAVSSFATIAPFIMGYGLAFAVPAAVIGVLIGDRLAPVSGPRRTVAFLLLGTTFGAVLGTPVIGGLSGAAGGIAGSFGRGMSAEGAPARPPWFVIIIAAGFAVLWLFGFLPYFIRSAGFD